MVQPPRTKHYRSSADGVAYYDSDFSFLEHSETDECLAYDHRLRLVEAARYLSPNGAEGGAVLYDSGSSQGDINTGIDDPNELPNVESAEKRVERLLRERENMGPVNLLAESEASELEEQIETLQSEREDLITAIGKLRRSISELNREGRQRLLKSFEEVNTHFKKLFVCVSILQRKGLL